MVFQVLEKRRFHLIVFILPDQRFKFHDFGEIVVGKRRRIIFGNFGPQLQLRLSQDSDGGLGHCRFS